ncbi:hypothetical protein FOA43_003621 [Brettanomyces nanus]|uniref:PIPK domain-containing protein n=1 Tax=Eeniella nana TaxID=13502 RepID=A0A875S7H3_EENNA|nr:uncharacterized protein FOA43_003621 [Brettanomyces nanus]QPG76235.1 hypothetical protein FOA43_003621 [Brettanomyces nanus]
MAAEAIKLKNRELPSMSLRDINLMSVPLRKKNGDDQPFTDALDSLSLNANSDTLIGASSNSRSTGESGAGSSVDSGADSSHRADVQRSPTSARSDGDNDHHMYKIEHTRSSLGDCVPATYLPEKGHSSTDLNYTTPKQYHRPATLRPFKSPSFSIDLISKSRQHDDIYNALANTTRRNSTMALTTSNVERHGYNETGTITIPEAYEKTERAKEMVLRDHGRIHNNRSQSSLSNRHRFPKTGSFTNKEQRHHPSERYVIPGQRVVEGHHNYALAYNMITGIRVAVSRCSQIPKPLTDYEYKQVSKMVFHWEGSSTTPSSKYEFKFKDYAPEVFRDLRSVFHIDQADYLLALTEKVALTELGSPGKSGSFFYYSGDYRFIIKTIHHSEHCHLRKILKQYHDYVVQNPDTLLCQFYGLHRLKMHTRRGLLKLHIVVMNNIFPPTREIHKRFDLKGSTSGRYTNLVDGKVEGKTSLCLKDLNFLKSNEKIHLGPQRKGSILAQIHNDVEFLQRTNIMDYSLLLGVHNLTEDELTTPVDQEPEFFSNRDREVSNIFALADGGIRAADENGHELPVIYYMAIIDCLTNYSTLKRLETFFRSFKHKRSTISAVPPIEYGKRFYKFLEKGITPANTARENKDAKVKPIKQD